MHFVLVSSLILDVSSLCRLEVSPLLIPSIKYASLLHRVEIGADVPSGSGTLKCDGAISPDGSVMGAIDSSKPLTLLNFACPWFYQ